MAGGRPLKFKTVQELSDQIEAYFISCQNPDNPSEYIKPVSITGMANHLGTNRETLINYEARDEYFDTIKAAKSKCEQWVEENAMMNKTNATFAIFNLKNNYGWKDKTETESTVKMEVSDRREEIEAALDELI